jgi:hypothetical protein
VPVIVTLEIVTFEFPVFVIVAVSDLLLPTCTFPKLKLAEDELRVFVAAVPLPVREIDICDGDPFVASVMVPVDEVADVGAKTALKFSDAPAAIVLDVVRPEMLNPVPLTLT